MNGTRAIFRWAIAPRRLNCIYIILTVSVFLCGAHPFIHAHADSGASSQAAADIESQAISDALLRASGDLPTAKTEKTIKSEKELERLASDEKALKERILEATINRSKLLSQKRSELRLARQKRDEGINAEITALKNKKTKQANIVREIKAGLSMAKKLKSKLAATTLEISLIAAEIKLDDINADLRKANEKLSKSYADYKAIYDYLTKKDEELKKILDINSDAESKIKLYKADFKETKSEYDMSVKGKDFLTAERRMSSLVFIQTAINNGYSGILDIKQKVKSDYYNQIVNYSI
jgi:hypothetical protein